MNLSLGVHADAGIADRQQDVLPRRDLDALVVRSVQCHVTCRDGETPTLWHGIPCVHPQVHDDLLNLTSISPHCTDLRIELQHCFDIVPQQTWQHFRQVLHYVAKIEDRWFEHLFPTVSQQLASHRGGFGASILDAAGVFNYLLRVSRGLVQKLCVPADNHEQVVEVVGDSAR